MTEKGQSSNASSKKTIALERTQTAKEGGSLIGRIEAPKELNRNTVLSMVQKGWQLKAEVEILDIEKNVFVFQFLDRGDYMKVLKGRPWSVQSYLLNLQQWDDKMVYKEVSFDRCPFWVQFHGLPFAYMNYNNAIKLGSLIGEVVMVENPRKKSSLSRNFLRARVLVDINNPLTVGFWVPREAKKDTWAEIKYERLPTICYKCGRMGHEQRLCKYTKEKVDEEASFGSHLKGQTPKTMEETMMKVKEGWCEWQQSMFAVARSLTYGEERGSEIPRGSGICFAQGGRHGSDNTNFTSQLEASPRRNMDDLYSPMQTPKKESQKEGPGMQKSHSSGRSLGLIDEGHSDGGPKNPETKLSHLC